MIRGFLFAPMIKSSFPKENDPRVKENPDLKLADHDNEFDFMMAKRILKREHET
ncbi:MAG: hypothetical protein U9P90_02360 [Patescibacteria group bacterium]|nr:hypothetical protein [Patescibacteria group bacterium]